MNLEISLSFCTFHLHFPRRLSESPVCTANTYRPTYVLLCQLIDICRNCLEPVCAFCRGAKLKNIGAGSVQGEDFKTVGPGGAQRSKLDRSAAEDWKQEERSTAEVVHYFCFFHKLDRLVTPNYRKKGLHYWYSEEALHQSFSSLWSLAALTLFLVVMLPSSLSLVVWARLNLDKLKTKATKACVSMSKAEINRWHLTSVSVLLSQKNSLAIIKNKQELLKVPGCYLVGIIWS